ncbi:ABC transporter ATP-binding protein [bacterium]|nr:ABC transporter ATP-binding protein [bacterium]
MPPGHHSTAAQYDESELGKVFDARLMRRLSRYLRPYMKWVLLAISMAILAAGLRVLGPWIARHIINNYVPADSPERRHGLTLYTGLYLLLLAGMFVNNFFLAYITAWVGQRGMYDLRKDIFRKLSKLSLSFFDLNPSGRLLTRTTSDVQVLNELLSEGVVYIFADFVLLFGILIAWLVFDWRLGLLLVFTGPLLGLAAYNFRIRARSAYRAVRVRIAALNSYLQENLAGVRTVQAFNRERESLRRYSAMNGRYRDAQVDTIKHFALFFPLVEIISYLAIVIVLAYGGWMVAGRGETGLTAGDFFLYFQYIAWFFMPIQDLAEKYNIFQGAMASAERIFALLDEPIQVQDPPEATKSAPLEEGVELRDVWFAYTCRGEEMGNDGRPGTRSAPAGEEEWNWVLRGVSLQVEKGQTVALVGATGAGKSTVINLLTRLYDVQRGSVSYDGRDVREYDQESLRRRMSVVLQDVFLFSGTIKDNIRLGDKEITDEQVRQAARYVNAERFIQRLPQGYDSEVLERGATFSTGQKQLLAFARAVAFNPDILILDEATANIDTETEALIQDALAKLMRNRTSIVVAHRLSTIQNANKIVVFHHGRIHEQGTHQELLKRDGVYRRLYELQYKA